MKLSQFSSVRNHIVIVILLAFAMFIMVSPAVANTSTYNWLAWDWADTLNGANNGVFHTLTAGTLTNSGSLWVTRTLPNPLNPPHPWKIQVKRQQVGPDPTICTTGWITPSVMVGSQYAVSYSMNCGNISASSSYYLIIWRTASDGREVQGTGTLHTP